MLFYNIGSLIKIIAGSSIIRYIYNYINIYQDKEIALGFGFLGVFLVCWGISFYIFFISQRFISKRQPITIASNSYKLSLLFGLFILINIGMILIESWTKIIGISILITFIILQILIIGDDE